MTIRGFKVAMGAAMLVFAVGLCALPVCLGGCSRGSMSAEQVTAAQAAVETAKATLATQQRQWADALAAATAAADARKQAEAQKALDTIVALQKQAEKAGELLRAATNPDGRINAGGAVAAGLTTAAPFLPPGANVAALLLAALVPSISTWFVKNGQVKTAVDAGKSLVNAMDTLFIKSPEASAAYDTHAGAIEGQMTPAAKALMYHESIVDTHVPAAPKLAA